MSPKTATQVQINFAKISPQGVNGYERIKPKWRERVKVYDEEPAQLVIRGIASAERVWQLPSRESLDPLDDLHAWEREQLDVRWNYKPHQPLYLLAVRVYRLATPHIVANTPRYAGCKSWVDLDAADAIDDAGATPVVSDAAFAALVSRINDALKREGEAPAETG